MSRGVSVGDTVHFMSGRALGRVELATMVGFRVTGPLGSFWLSYESVFVHDGFGDVTLVCEQAGLANYSAGGFALGSPDGHKA